MCCINNAPSQVEIFEKLEENKYDRHRNDSIRKGFLDPELYGEIRPEQQRMKANSLKVKRGNKGKY
jgi:hypothetical protein